MASREGIDSLTLSQRARFCYFTKFNGQLFFCGVPCGLIFCLLAEFYDDCELPFGANNRLGKVVNWSSNQCFVHLRQFATNHAGPVTNQVGQLLKSDLHPMRRLEE